MISKCNIKYCPGWAFALAIGLIMYLASMIMLVQDTMANEVRVVMTRELPDETQHIVQTFPDADTFAMWMGTKMEEGSDPYVRDIKITLPVPTEI